MKISADTKISQLIKENPGCIDVIASINPHFNKLRNPLLRRVLAPRVTIREAAKIGGSTVDEFFAKLSPLGFDFEPRKEEVGLDNAEKDKGADVPYGSSRNKIVELDVRDDLANNRDPFKKIMEKTSALRKGETLLLINSFVPIPLIKILEKKGYEINVETQGEQLVYTYITLNSGKVAPASPVGDSGILDSVAFKRKMKEFKGMIESVDVSNMEMPMPMVTVLERLASLPEGDALFVLHHKVPHFLLPELKERGYSYIITQESYREVFILIYKESSTL